MHGDVFSPAGTRPLSIVNIDNRLIANAFRCQLEPVFNDLISDCQRGLLKGRSMLSNILDIDEHAMKIIDILARPGQA